MVKDSVYLPYVYTANKIIAIMRKPWHKLVHTGMVFIGLTFTSCHDTHMRHMMNNHTSTSHLRYIALQKLVEPGLEFTTLHS